MNLVENVYELSERFMEEPKHVFILTKGIENLAKKMLENGKIEYIRTDNKVSYRHVVLELVASSVNYCYWYGQHDIRPNGASSGLMYDILEHSFTHYMTDDMTFSTAIKKFIKELIINRFPLIEDRIRHLNQLLINGEEYSKAVFAQHESIEPHLIKLISLFPGFASDMFLKRSSLFFIELFRNFGWFEKDLHRLHVPADYQIPKMLEYFDCIVYEDELDNAVHEGILITKDSRPECEIRSATILVIKELCELTEWNVSEVDTFLFTKRHKTEKPFHLTTTTDY